MQRLLKPRRRFVIALCLVALFCRLPATAEAGDATNEAGTRLLDSVKYLSSDALEGRGVGTDGINQAAEFVRDEFEKAGLDTRKVNQGAFQSFSMVTGAKLTAPGQLTFHGPDNTTIELKEGTDFVVCGFSGSGKCDAPIAFGGYGIDAEEQKYHDFKGIDLAGKAVIIMRRTPQQENPHGPFNAPHGRLSQFAELRTKIRNAVEAKAAAILFVNDPYSVRKNAETDQSTINKASERVVAAAEELEAVEPADAAKVAEGQQKLFKSVRALKQARQDRQLPDNDPLMQLNYMARVGGQEIPVMHVTVAACDRILSAALGKTLEQLESEIDADLKPRSTLLDGWKAIGSASIEKARVDVKNVVGVLEGEGPLADETVVVGAHYDHVGLGGEGSLAPGSKEVHNGADDNASGTSGLIELARRLAARPQQLPRRVVFIAFTGEELGLLGSAHYVKEPLFPLDKTVAMFNMDMIGRLKDDKLTVFGTGTSPGWDKLISDLAAKQNLQLVKKPDGFGPSDHSSFYGKKIPVLHFFTGTHSDYHRPSDDWEKINAEGMARVLSVVEGAIIATAEAPTRPEYVAVKGSGPTERGGSRPYFGSVPDFGSEASGYAISGVSPESPADKAGLKGGDVITQIGPHKIANLEDFDAVLRKFAPGDEVEVRVLRNKETITFKLILGKPR